MATYVRLLGAPAIEHGGERHTPAWNKRTALVCYLACRGEWVGRDVVAYLFWPDVVDANARSNLRNLLSRALRSLPGVETIEAERTRLRWDVPTDVKDFRRAVAQRRWAAAASLYRGGLLQGLDLDDAPEFDAWLAAERSQLEESWLAAILAYSEELEAAERFGEAAEVLAPLLGAASFDEEIVRRHLALLQASGQRARALRRFDTFRRTLHDEFGAEPEEATLVLARQIESAVPAAPAATDPRRPRRDRAGTEHDLPPQATSFIGRTAEQERLLAQLAAPDCRLLTIAAPGGMGKTRLAIAVAERYAAGGGVSARFVHFAPIDDPEQMVYAVADAVGATLSGRDDPRTQLLSQLANREMLLVLDNLEHLLSGVDLIDALLDAAPKIKVLATSRERLNVRAERLFELGGLAVPAGESSDEAAASEAVALFLDSARRIDSDIVLTEGNAPAIARICRLTEGMPLALELAASWLGILSLGDIAAEIERGIDLLESDLRDLPERQRSIRAVYNASWQQLSASEQEVFAKLSVFRGGFSRDAARRIAGAGLGVLRTLANKSLLTATAGRYRIHELLRQFAAEQLPAAQEAPLRSAHSRYYARLITDLQKVIFSDRQLEAEAEIELELENVRAALDWALAQGDAAVFSSPLCLCLSTFFQFQGRYAEALALFSAVIDTLERGPLTPDGTATLMEAVLMRSWYLLRFGRLDEAEAAAERSLELCRRGVALYDATASYPQTALAAVALARGHYPDAEHFASSAARQAETLGHRVNLEAASYYLARVALARGETARAEALADRAIALAKDVGEIWFRAYVLIVLGDIATTRGDFDEAARIFQESHDLRSRFRDPEGVALASNRLGDTAMARGRFAEAREHYRTARRHYERIGDFGGLSRALVGLGDTALAAGQIDEARDHLRQALEIAAERSFHRITLRVIVGVARLLFRTDRAAEAAAVLEFARHHHAGDPDLHERIEALRRRFAAPTAPTPSGGDLESVIGRLRQALR